MNDTETTALAHPKPVRRPVRRLLVIGAITGAGVYLLTCVGLFVFQERLIFFPSPAYASTPADVRLGYEEIRLTAADGVSPVAWYIPHPAARGTVLYFHGNAENIGDLVQSAWSLHRMGLSALLAEYRGYGRNDGSPSEEGLYRDAEAAWRYLVETRGLPPDRIVLLGRSLGGAVAIYLARQHPPAALVVESTFTSLVDVAREQYPWFPVGWLCRHRFESVTRVPSIACPKLFFHGTADTLIPMANARRLFAAAAEPKEFIQTPGDHNSNGFEYDQNLTRRFADWLDKVLAGGKE